MNKELPKSASSYEEWELLARELIELELERKGLRYKDLARLLKEIGIDESPTQINRKVNRKRFSAAFLVACMRAMDVKSISLV